MHNYRRNSQFCQIKVAARENRISFWILEAPKPFSIGTSRKLPGTFHRRDKAYIPVQHRTHVHDFQVAVLGTQPSTEWKCCARARKTHTTFPAGKGSYNRALIEDRSLAIGSQVGDPPTGNPPPDARVWNDTASQVR